MTEGKTARFDLLDTLRSAASGVASPVGARLLVLFAGLHLLRSSTLQSQAAQLEPTDAGLPTEFGALLPDGGPLVLDLPLGVLLVLSLAVLLCWSGALVVAFRTFAGRERQGQATVARRLAFATVNMLVAIIAVRIVVVLGLVALVVPGIVAGVVLAFVPAAVAVDDQNVLAATVHSGRIARERWRSILKFLAAVVLLWLLYLVVTVLPIGLAGAADPLLGEFVSAALQALATTYGTAAFALAFVRLEGPSDDGSGEEDNAAEDDPLADVPEELLP